MLNNFKKYQTTLHTNIINYLIWIHGEDYGHSMRHARYTNDLYGASISIINKLKLMPDKVERKEFRDKDCVELIYYLNFCDHLYIRMQPDLYSYYISKKDQICASTTILSPHDRYLTSPIIEKVSNSINNLTKDLLEKRMKEYDYKPQTK